VLVYQIQSYRHWQQHFGRHDDDYGFGQFGENLTVDGLPDDEVCIGDRYRIGAAEFEVTPAPGHLLPGRPAPRPARTARAAGQPPPPRVLPAGHPGRAHPGGRPDHQDQHRPARAHRGRHRRAALPPAPGPGQAACTRCRSRRSAPAGSSPSATCWPPPRGPVQPARQPVGTEPAPAPPPDWAGFRALRVDRVVPESTTVSSIYLAATGWRRACRPRRPAQYLTLLGRRGRPARPGAQLLAVQPTGWRPLSDQRQSTSHTAPSAATLTRRLRPRRAAGRVPRRAATSSSATAPARCLAASSRPASGLTPVLSMLRRLARAAQRARGVVAARGAQARRNIRSRPRRRPARRSPACPRARLLQPGPRYRTPVPGHGRSAVQRQAGWSGPAGPRGCLHLWSGLVHGRPAARAHRESASARNAFHTDLFGALPSVNPGLTGQHRRPPHQPPGPPGPGPLVTFAAQRHLGRLRRRLAQRARPGRQLRRAHPVELPDRRLPHLCGRRCSPARWLPPGPARTARRRRGADLLRAARLRPRPGHVRQHHDQTRSRRRQPGRGPAAAHLCPATGPARPGRPVLPRAARAAHLAAGWATRRLPPRRNDVRHPR